MKNLSRRILTLLAFAICAVGIISASIISEAIDTLDLMLKNQPEVKVRRNLYVDSLKRDTSLKSGYRKSIQLADAYRGLNNDSSIYYYSKAYKQAEKEQNTAAMRYILPELSEKLGKTTRFKEAFETLDTINLGKWSNSEKIHYYTNLAHIYLDAANYINFQYKKRDYELMAIESLDSLLSIIKDPRGIALINAQKYFLNDNSPLALGELNEVFGDYSPFSPEYAIAAYMLASYYKDKADHADDYMYYLTLAAISDARRANGEAAALVFLGRELMRRGELTRAFNYLTIAGELIEESNSDIYSAEIAPSLSNFAKVWAKKKTESRQTMILIVIIAGLLILGLSYMLFIVNRRRKDGLKEIRGLNESINNRDQYIDQLLNLCGVYVEGMSEFNRLIYRKLKANQVQDLYKMTESGQIIREHTDEFFQVFDRAVFKIFPNFISDINALLAEGSKISEEDSGHLTPELRILAFMRMGVTDNNRLSKFLGLSLNTIYTYRNRMKSRAKNRETFEKDVMNS